MRIEKLFLRDIGPFDELRLELPEKTAKDKAEIHILTGPNGSGKSTILRTMAWGLVAPWNSLFGAEGIESLRRGVDWFAEMVSSDRSVAMIRSNEGKTFSSMSTGNPYQRMRTSLVEEQWIKSGSDNVMNAVISAVQNWPNNEATPAISTAVFAYAGVRSITNANVSVIQELQVSPHAGALSFAQTASTGHLLQWVANAKTKAALASRRNDEATAERHDGAVRIIESAIADMLGVELKFEMDDNPLSVVIRIGGERMPLHVLPDGLKSVLSWIADLLMRLDRMKWSDDTPAPLRNFLLLLDEIDIHLHPEWQRKILPAVQTLFPNAQIIISTHSPFVVASVSDAWVHSLGLNGNRATARPAIKSGAGQSYVSILRNVFGVDQEFDPVTEGKLLDFYSLRDRALRHEPAASIELEKLAAELAGRGLEVADIVTREVRQVRRALAANGSAHL